MVVSYELLIASKMFALHKFLITNRRLTAYFRLLRFTLTGRDARTTRLSDWFPGGA